ncbi:hypothetical protein C7N83_05565 [Neisseria iguanae]|uniref:Uncharacterized protein n=2 Tax=Neisseria iguanae TaxID=90242 RepID=A0A2P7U0N9_9NEIS|nr:hypothetical protein C7N83_05565 [Neisseria iguanae]
MVESDESGMTAADTLRMMADARPLKESLGLHASGGCKKSYLPAKNLSLPYPTPESDRGHFGC